MGATLSTFWRMVSRLSFLVRRKSETQLKAESKATDIDFTRCCNDVTCTSAAKSAKELLAKMEELQTQLQNEVIAWKLRLIRGICTEESRTRFYEFLRQFTTLNGVLDSLIESEVNYLEVLQQKKRKNEGDDDEQFEDIRTEAHQNRENSDDKAALVNAYELKLEETKEKTLKRRRKFFSKIHERNVKLLFVVLNEVDECRSMIGITSSGHEMSLNCTLELKGTRDTSLGVLEESREELTTA